MKLERSAQNNQVFSALDSTCQQKDRYGSRLYWYTSSKLSRSRKR